MNLPNKLTLLRILLVPVFVAILLLGEALRHSFLIAGVIFGFAAYTDHLDGKIARKRNLITDFGKFMDPLADKIMVISALVCFIELQIIPSWCVILIIAREFMVTSIRLVAAPKGIVIAANIWGKIKTVSQIISIAGIMLLSYFTDLSKLGVSLGVLTKTNTVENIYPVLNLLLIITATVITVISGAVYLIQNWDAVKTAK